MKPCELRDLIISAASLAVLVMGASREQRESLVDRRFRD
jgi:hypothetical protein